MSERLAVFNATEGGFGLPTGLPAVAEETTSIYALNCPVSGRLRYVGKSDNPEKRLRAHIGRAAEGRFHRAVWLRSLLSKGSHPVLEVIDRVPKNEWAFWECEYIRLFRAIGFDLVNTAEGGEGTSLPGNLNPNFGKTLPAWHKEILRVRQTGNVRSADSRAKQSASTKGVPKPEGWGENITAKQTGVPKHKTCGKPKYKSCSSQYVGVYWNATNKTWVANISQSPGPGQRRKTFYLGTFSTEELAARAVDKRATELRGDKAKLNFPNE